MSVLQQLKNILTRPPSPFLKIVIQSAEADAKPHLKSLLCQKADVLIIKNSLPNHLLQGIETRLLHAAATHTVVHIGEDGYVLPMPYSMIQKRFADTDPLEQYQQASISAQPVLEAVLTPPLIAYLQAYINALHTPSPVPVPIRPGQTLSSLNLRLLKAGKNGIDIHCENAFIQYLYEPVRDRLHHLLDLENALSFVFMLQAPESGGEFVLYNKDWDTAPYNITKENYNERHRIDAPFFETAGYGKAEYQKIKIENGDLIMFRAAQLWHSINTIQGKTNRITIGGFLAQSKSENKGGLFYWS